ncbi:hypothetical protein GCM10023084_62360 [Streptomyces lacrimifluminis]|uniref:Uncharacterized protein n=1 Tax=Streptomyces lacrimifluminis TaxID=1500077 RepID=A0A917L4Y8_9ACTN|nr:hypothetical protein [Streptomyces lacrimifluminis]GGJ44841.1 hypothetical protein GCM10012282_47200 [Streptomyces lacrimifluminis]
MTVPSAGTTHGMDGPSLPPAGADQPARRPPGRTRLVGSALIMLSLIPALGCYLEFTAWLPSDTRRHQDYVAAEPCPGDATAKKWEDCLRTVSFNVESTKNKLSKSGSYKATLSGTSFWNGVVAFGDPGPLLERLRPGDQVTATVWRGDVMTVSNGGVRQRTSEEPRSEPQMTVAIGTFLGLLAATGIGLGAVRMTRPHGHEPFTWRSYGKPLLITMTITCAVVGLPAVWFGLPSWVVPTVAVTVVACTAGLLHQHRRPSAARGA